MCPSNLTSHIPHFSSALSTHFCRSDRRNCQVGHGGADKAGCIPPVCVSLGDPCLLSRGALDMGGGWAAAMGFLDFASTVSGHTDLQVFVPFSGVQVFPVVSLSHDNEWGNSFPSNFPPGSIIPGCLEERPAWELFPVDKKPAGGKDVSRMSCGEEIVF